MTLCLSEKERICLFFFFLYADTARVVVSHVLPTRVVACSRMGVFLSVLLGFPSFSPPLDLLRLCAGVSSETVLSASMFWSTTPSCLFVLLVCDSFYTGSSALPMPARPTHMRCSRSFDTPTLNYTPTPVHVWVAKWTVLDLA